MKGPTSQTTVGDPTEAADLPAEVAGLGLLGLHLLNPGTGHTNPSPKSVVKRRLEGRKHAIPANLRLTPKLKNKRKIHYPDLLLSN